jgi:hypothetical protein
MQRQRAQTAQRMHAQGTLSGGGFDSAVERLGSEQGAQEQAFQGQLLGKFRDQNLDRMSRALQLGTGLLSQEQEQMLRAMLTREGTSQQERLSRAELEQRALLAQLGR